ncbi:kinase-like domain-containing protein [Pavlovales sp. CCMP2436]|nr:kinase-like domain-containing protein [Pavlovales sp. CCMP2436]
MVKQAIIADATPAELADLCLHFGFGDGTPASVRTTQLFGGYSAQTFRVEAAGRVAVLKICKGYSEADVRAQAAIQGVIGVRGFRGGCSALPLTGSGDGYVALSSRGDPACMLTHVEGSPADKALDAGLDAVAVLRAVGEQLARLHLVPVSAAVDKLRTYHEGGVCNLADHLSGDSLREMEGSEHTRAHPFVSTYRMQLAELRAATAAAEALPTGVLHGDPFLDNVLVSSDVAPTAASPEPKGALSVYLVDFEDATVGPLIFDCAYAMMLE